MDDVITIKELNDCLDMIFKNKDNDNVIFIDKDMKKELCRTYKLLFDYSKLLEKRINKAKTYIEQYEIIHKGLSYEEERLLDILGGNYDDTL